VLAIGDPALQLGVDAEVVRPRARLDALARRSLDAGAYERWLSTPDADRLVTFLRAWTAKEAYLKAVGLGIATSLQDVPAAPPGFTFYPVDVWPDAVVTVAVDTADAEVVVQAE
jgi:phosphopantetheinyl transferase